MPTYYSTERVVPLDRFVNQNSPMYSAIINQTEHNVAIQQLATFTMLVYLRLPYILHSYTCFKGIQVLVIRFNDKISVFSKMFYYSKAVNCLIKWFWAMKVKTTNKKETLITDILLFFFWYWSLTSASFIVSNRENKVAVHYFDFGLLVEVSILGFPQCKKGMFAQYSYVRAPLVSELLNIV